MRVELWPEEIAGAAGVRQKVMNGDLGSDVLIGIVGEIFSQRIGELELARLTSCRTAMAVNILFIEPMRNRVLSLLGIFFSRSAKPYAAVKIGLPFFGDQARHRKRDPLAAAFSNWRDERTAPLLLIRGIANSAGVGIATQIEIGDAMRLRSLNINHEPRELIGAPLLDDAGEMRRRGLFGFLIVKSARSAREIPSRR